MTLSAPEKIQPCPECGRPLNLNLDGTVREHLAVAGRLCEFARVTEHHAPTSKKSPTPRKIEKPEPTPLAERPRQLRLYRPARRFVLHPIIQLPPSGWLESRQKAAAASLAKRDAEAEKRRKADAGRGWISTVPGTTRTGPRVFQGGLPGHGKRR